MAIRLVSEPPPDLSGLDAAVRLKAELMRHLATTSPAEWPGHVSQFLAAIDRSALRDTTALLVLLATVRAELQLLIGLGGPLTRHRSGESDAFGVEAWSGSSKQEILTRFRQVVAIDLMKASRSSLSVSSIVARAMSFIEEHYAEPVTADRVAETVGRSRTHVGTVFRRETGLAIHEYLIRVRLRHAIALIRDGNKIEAVSLLVGYRSKKNFYHHFKSRFGLTPVRYRAALVDSDPPSSADP